MVGDNCCDAFNTIRVAAYSTAILLLLPHTNPTFPRGGTPLPPRPAPAKPGGGSGCTVCTAAPNFNGWLRREKCGGGRAGICGDGKHATWLHTAAASHIASCHQCGMRTARKSTCIIAYRKPAAANLLRHAVKKRIRFFATLLPFHRSPSKLLLLVLCVMVFI